VSQFETGARKRPRRGILKEPKEPKRVKEPKELKSLAKEPKEPKEPKLKKAKRAKDVVNDGDNRGKSFKKTSEQN
jgi:hypothetical protein